MWGTSVLDFLKRWVGLGRRDEGAVCKGQRPRGCERDMDPVGLAVKAELVQLAGVGFCCSNRMHCGVLQFERESFFMCVYTSLDGFLPLSALARLRGEVSPNVLDVLVPANPELFVATGTKHAPCCAEEGRTTCCVVLHRFMDDRASRQPRRADGHKRRRSECDSEAPSFKRERLALNLPLSVAPASPPPPAASTQAAARHLLHAMCKRLVKSSQTLLGRVEYESEGGVHSARVRLDLGSSDLSVSFARVTRPAPPYRLREDLTGVRFDRGKGALVLRVAIERICKATRACKGG